MIDIITSLTLLGYCLAIRRFLRWPIEATPFFIVSCTIVLFYAFAYANILQPASLVFILLGGLCLITAPFYLPHNKKELFEKYFTPGLVIFILLAIIFGAMAHQQWITSWDDLARWFPNAKLTYLHAGFLHLTDSTQDFSYPPGGVLFYYLFLRLSDFSEGQLLFAQTFLLLTPWVILLRKYQWSSANTGLVITLLLIAILIPLKVNLGPGSTIMMDSPTGLFFGGILASYYLMPKDRYRWLYLIIPTAALVLFKPMLLPFVAIIGTVIICDQLYQVKQRQIKFPSLQLFFLCIAPVLVSVSWQHHLKKLNIATGYSLANLHSVLFNTIAQGKLNQLKIIMVNNAKSFITPLLFCTIILLLIYRIYQCTSNRFNKNRLLIAHSMLFSGFLAYTGLLLLVYAFQMSPEMADTLNSFGRLMSVYYVGWLLVMLSHALYLTDKSVLPLSTKALAKLKNIAIACLAILLCLYISIYYYVDHLNFLGKNNVVYERIAINQLVNQIHPFIKNDSKIYILWVGSDGLMAHIINDELLPRKTQSSDGTFSSQTDFINQISPFDYLLLAHTDQNFWQKYGKLFQNSRQPLTTVTLCANADFTVFGKKGCTVQTVPVYLYKVIHHDGKLKFLNEKNASNE